MRNIMANIIARARGKTGPKGPSKPLDDLDVVIEMIKIQCTKLEICAVLGISEDTLTRRIREKGIEGVVNFADLYEKHSHEGKASLRRAQWKAAHNGNVTMQIWLGKQMLGQRDQIKQSVEITGANGGPVQTLDFSKLSTDLLLELSKAITDAAPEDHDGGPRLN
jgi:tRNA threonylcarbamoyladenosine modification (KEOPS) complex Cgi121 subunit